jgi:hypothetical protein
MDISYKVQWNSIKAREYKFSYCQTHDLEGVCLQLIGHSDRVQKSELVLYVLCSML